MKRLVYAVFRIGATAVLVLCLISLLGVAVIGMDPNFIQGVEGADFDIRLDKVDASAGYQSGCWITGLPVAGLNEYESWMYSFGYFSRLAQYHYNFAVNDIPQTVVWPWQFNEEVKHCSPFQPKRQPLPGEVNL